MTSAHQPMLQLSGVTKRFGGLDALLDIDLTVNQGQIYSIIGPNGAGKTTLFNLASCLLEPSAGQIVFNGENITGLAAHELSKRGMARTFQNLAVFKHETVIDNILTGMHAHLNTNIWSAALFWEVLGKLKLQRAKKPKRLLNF